MNPNLDYLAVVFYRLILNLSVYIYIYIYNSIEYLNNNQLTIKYNE